MNSRQCSCLSTSLILQRFYLYSYLFPPLCTVYTLVVLILNQTLSKTRDHVITSYVHLELGTTCAPLTAIQY